MPGILHLTDCDGGGVPAVIDAILQQIPGHIGFVDCAPREFAHRACIAFELKRARSRHPLKVLRTLAMLIGQVKALRPSLIHGHSSFGGVYGALLSKRLQVPFIYTPHASPSLIPEKSLLTRIIIHMEALSCLSASRVLACSEDERNALRKLCPPGLLEVLPNGVEPGPLKIGRMEWDVLAVGRLSRQKRPDIFAAVAQELVRARPGTRIGWIGGGEAPPRSADVQWLGEMPEARVDALLSRTRVFLSTSDYEGLSLAALRAASNGCLLGLRDTVGTRAPIQLGAEGFLLMQESRLAAEQIACAIDKLSLWQDHERTARAQRARDLFSLHRQLNRLARVYDEVVVESGPQ